MEFLKALGVDFKLVVVQAVGFLILLFFLKKYLFNTILTHIRTRTEEIKGIYDKIEKDKEEVAGLKASYERRIAEAEEEAERKITIAVKEAKKMSESMIEKTRHEVEAMKAKAQELIELEKKKAVAEIRNQVIDLSLFISSKLIQQSMSHKTAEKLVNDFMKEVKEIPC